MRKTPVIIFHWCHVAFLAIMVWSGVRIYWANDVYISIPEGIARGLGIDHHLADGMAWHFLTMWFYALNGAAYVAYLILSGSWRRLFPTRSDLARAPTFLLQDFKTWRTPFSETYNPVQKISYTLIIALGAASLLTGAAIYKPVQASALTELLGGYSAARLEHFVCTFAFGAFWVVHLIQVARAGWPNFRGILTADPTPLRRSLSFGAVAATAGLAIFFTLQNQPESDGIQKTLRNALEFNGSLFARFYSPARLSPERPRKLGSARLNGDLGLNDDFIPEKILVTTPEQRIEVRLDELRTLPLSRTSTDFKCIEGWSEVFDYAGVRFSDFMKHFSVGRKSDGSLYRYVGLETPNGEYYVSVDMDSMLHPQTFLAYELNGLPLTPAHGAPLRLITPVKYGIKSLKRIGKITFSDQRPPDYWAEQGYDWYAGL